MSASPENIISQTRNWIEQVVIGLNFCPFAAKSFKDEVINYKVIQPANLNLVLESLIQECNRLEDDEVTETSLLILPEIFDDFDNYLDLVDLAEQLLIKEGFEGVYQVASFHPNYLFSGSDEKDPANYTNRSPYPMLHILREDRLEKAILKHKNAAAIPDANIAKANELGLAYFKALRF
jgi:hypothetical protein